MIQQQFRGLPASVGFLMLFNHLLTIIIFLIDCYLNTYRVPGTVLE